MAETEQRLLMLIDDEPAQSRLIGALASRAGWRTLVVADAETAIATLGTRQGMQLSAIILDQWVPGDEACELIAELKARRPGLPILLATGYADLPDPSGVDLPRLAKPYGQEQLGAELGKLLRRIR